MELVKEYVDVKQAINNIEIERDPIIRYGQIVVRIGMTKDLKT